MTVYYKDYIRQLCIVFYKQHVQYHFVFLSAFFYFIYLCIKFSFMTLVLYLVDLKSEDQRLYRQLNQKTAPLFYKQGNN